MAALLEVEEARLTEESVYIAEIGLTPLALLELRGTHLNSTGVLLDLRLVDPDSAEGNT